MLDKVLEKLRPELIKTLQDLVQIPSENIPPNGNEGECQAYVAEQLRRMGLEPDIYELTEVPQLSSHPEYWPGRNYQGRPNVNAVLRGSSGGRSLILSGHIDTVPADTPVAWTRAPFGAEISDGKLYGRGAWDMKAGVAMNLTIFRAFTELSWKPKGDLIFETVVDEEFGGVNGTLAGRLRGYNADAAVIGEPTSLAICPAQRGGRTLHIVLQGRGGILAEEQPAGRAVEQLTYVLTKIPEFAERRRRRVPTHAYYAGSKEPFAVWVTNISTGRWGWTQPITVPERCKVEIYWQAMPDETREEVEGEFFAWWNEILSGRPDLFQAKPIIEFPMRWLPGCATPPDSLLVKEFVSTVASKGLEARVEGLDAPSDMYIFPRYFNTPALMWGPSGKGAHQPDEFVDIDSLFEATCVLAYFVSRWCGIQGAAR